MRTAGGFALMAAIFIIVTLAAIATYLLTVSTGQLQAGIQDEQAARAYQAARSGVDWGTYQLLRNSGGNFAANCDGAGSTETLVFAAPGLLGFRAKVDCTRVGSETEAANTISVYRLQVTGCNRNACPAAAGTEDPTYAERQIQLTLSRCTPTC